MSEALKFMESINGPTTVGMLLRAYRTRNDITQSDLAKLIVVSKSYVSDLENDRKDISLRQVVAFAEVLKESKELYIQVYFEQSIREAGQAALVVEVRSAQMRAEERVGKIHGKLSSKVTNDDYGGKRIFTLVKKNKVPLKADKAVMRATKKKLIKKHAKK